MKIRAGAFNHEMTEALGVNIKLIHALVFAMGVGLATIAGNPPDLSALPPGCSFAPRCNLATQACLQSTPDAVRCSETHVVRCLHTEHASAPAQSPRLS
jgi:oligopeptide/dipeptide ABC transporter ATP-binding protein